MLKDILYLTEGIEKKVSGKIQSLIEEGKKGYEDADIFEMGKEHVKKRKRQIEKLFLNDFKNIVEELGLATKKDIEELKDYIKNRN